MNIKRLFKGLFQKKRPIFNLTSRQLIANDGLPPQYPSWLALTKTIYSTKEIFPDFMTNNEMVLNIPDINGRIYKNQIGFIKDQLIEELLYELPEKSLLESNKPQSKIINYITDGEIN